MRSAKINCLIALQCYGRRGKPQYVFPSSKQIIFDPKFTYLTFLLNDGNAIWKPKITSWKLLQKQLQHSLNFIKYSQM